MSDHELTINIKTEIDEEELLKIMQQFLRSVADDLVVDAIAFEDDSPHANAFLEGVDFAADWLRAVANEDK